MKKVLFIVFPLLVSLASFSMVDNLEVTNSALSLVIDKLPHQLDDPVKEMEDTEEEDAFELLAKSSLTISQRDMLHRVVEVYSQILYNFPFAYPNYGNGELKCTQGVLQKYGGRLEILDKLLYGDVEWI